jgi:hypothetical protein
MACVAGYGVSCALKLRRGTREREMSLRLETDTSAEFLKFDADQAAIRLPKGKYVGQSVTPMHFLGENGADLTWLYVTILEAPAGAQEWVGKRVNVRIRHASNSSEQARLSTGTERPSASRN